MQNAELADAAGNKLRLTVWEHPDLTPLKGKELILHSSKNGKGVFGGVAVKHDSYESKKERNPDGSPVIVRTVELSVGKTGLFQEVAVYHQSTGTTPAPASQPAKTYSTGATHGSATYINGQTVGMAINNACSIIRENGYNPDTFSTDLISIASKILKVSQYLEKGEEKAAEEAPKKEIAPVVYKPKPEQTNQPDEDVPY